MTAIFNETPIRQERRFLHYGKSFETVKRDFARFLFREELVGAYAGDELIGFVFMGDAGRYASLGQIISAVRHRDKSPTNALVAKAIEICAERGIPHLVVRAVAARTAPRLQEAQRVRGGQAATLLRAAHGAWSPVSQARAAPERHRPVAGRRVQCNLRGIRSRYYARRYNR